MKNSIFIIVIILYQSLFLNNVFSKEIEFNATDIEVVENQNLTIANNGSAIIKDDEIIIEGVKIKYNITYSSSLYDLLKNYSNLLKKEELISTLTISSSELSSVDESIQRIKNMFGSINEWTNIMTLIPKFGLNNIVNKSLVTSNFVASLELSKNGMIEIKQNETFGNIFIKTKIS